MGLRTIVHVTCDAPGCVVSREFYNTPALRDVLHAGWLVVEKRGGEGGVRDPIVWYFHSPSCLRDWAGVHLPVRKETGSDV